MKISGPPKNCMMLFSTHPPLEERIAALEQAELDPLAGSPEPGSPEPAMRLHHSHLDSSAGRGGRSGLGDRGLPLRPRQRTLGPRAIPPQPHPGRRLRQPQRRSGRRRAPAPTAGIPCRPSTPWPPRSAGSASRTHRRWWCTTRTWGSTPAACGGRCAISVTTPWRCSMAAGPSGCPRAARSRTGEESRAATYLHAVAEARHGARGSTTCRRAWATAGRCSSMPAAPTGSRAGPSPSTRWRATFRARATTTTWGTRRPDGTFFRRTHCARGSMACWAARRPATW